MQPIVAAWDLPNFHFPIPLALALVALLGYFVGRLRPKGRSEAGLRSRRELRRAELVARELERIAWAIRRNLSRHHASLAKFKQRVGSLGTQQQEAAWKGLCHEANEILTPTLRLATQLSAAYDQLRQQSSLLMSFSEVRTDPLTGIHNRRSLEEAIAGQFALAARYQDPFSIVLLDIDHFKDVNDQQGHLQGDQVLQQVAELLDETARETDVVGRYGGEEFLLVLPRTDFEGACVLAERLRGKVQAECPVTISAGIATAQDGDTAESLLARADTALYRAKAAGRNRVFGHTGQEAEPIGEPELALASPVSW